MNLRGYVILHFKLTNISITCNSWDYFPPLPPPWVCTVIKSCYIRERNTLNALNWFVYTIVMLLCKERGGTYDPGICVLIYYVILQFKLTNISIICNFWDSFPVSLCLLPESALSPHHTILGIKNILPQQEIVLIVQLWFLSRMWTFLSMSVSEWQIREMQTTDWISPFIVLYTTVFVNTWFWLDARGW